MALDSTSNGEDMLLKTIKKLLDKAGKDPRLTPRILREKAEQRMELNKGDLKPKRDKIKDIIYDWWKKQKQDEIDKETAVLKALVRLARVSGNVPGAMKGVNELPSNQDKIKALRERLRAKGLVFSDVPTEAETAAAESAYNLKRDLDGIDPSLIISDSRKRPSSSSGSGSGGAAESGKERDGDGQQAPSARAHKPAGATAAAGGAGAGTGAPLVAVKAEATGGSKAKSPPSAGGPAAVKRQRVVAYSDEEAEF